MKILVCISHVPDTTTKIKFLNHTLDTSGIQWIINPWDELSLTRALELKEASGGTIDQVVVINVGNKDTEATIRKALAIGADSGIRINAEPKDAYYVSTQLAEVIKKENFDIILCGIESSDYNGSIVGGMLSELLDITSVSSVSAVNINGNEVSIDREIDGGKEILHITTPFLAIVQKGISKEPRIPSMRGIMSARTKALTVVEPVDLEPLTENIIYEMPQPKAACKIIDPDHIQELFDLLKNEAKVI